MLTGGAATIGLRVPDHDAPRALARAVGPLPTTSANVSGLPEATDAAGIVDQLGDVIDLVLDGGPAHGGPASTVVDCTGALPVILRVGAVPVAEVAAILERAGVDHDLGDGVRLAARPQPFRPRASTGHVSTTSPSRTTRNVSTRFTTGQMWFGTTVTTRPTSGSAAPGATSTDPVVVGDAGDDGPVRAPGSRRARPCRRPRPCRGSWRRRRRRTGRSAALTLTTRAATHRGDRIRRDRPEADLLAVAEHVRARAAPR